LYAISVENLIDAAVLVEKKLDIRLTHRDNAVFDEYFYADIGENREIFVQNNIDMDDYIIYGEGYIEPDFKEYGILIYIQKAEKCSEIIAKLNADPVHFKHLRTYKS